MNIELKDEKLNGQITIKDVYYYDDKVKVYYHNGKYELELKSGDVSFVITLSVTNEITDDIKNDSNIINYELVGELIDTLRKSPLQSHDKILRDFEGIFLKKEDSNE